MTQWNSGAIVSEQQHCLPDPQGDLVAGFAEFRTSIAYEACLSVETRSLWSMARAIDRGGVLWRFVPKQPRWCRCIGGEIDRALLGQQQPAPFDIQRLTYVIETAQARYRDQLTRRRKRRQPALRVFDRCGLVEWVPLRSNTRNWQHARCERAP